MIARNEYTKTEEKNPVDCSLFYLALRKKPVLVGLWRMATWSRERAATHRLLSNNFQESRWQTAALKNAYALMGKRRFGRCPRPARCFSITDRSKSMQPPSFYSAITCRMQSACFITSLEMYNSPSPLLVCTRATTAPCCEISSRRRFCHRRRGKGIDGWPPGHSGCSIGETTLCGRSWCVAFSSYALAY